MNANLNTTLSRTESPSRPFYICPATDALRCALRTQNPDVEAKAKTRSATMTKHKQTVQGTRGSSATLPSALPHSQGHIALAGRPASQGDLWFRSARSESYPMKSRPGSGNLRCVEVLLQIRSGAARRHWWKECCGGISQAGYESLEAARGWQCFRKERFGSRRWVFGTGRCKNCGKAWL